MRVVVVVAAMLFCTPVFAQGVKLKSVANSIGMELVEIPAGDFMMGSPEGEKDRQVNEDQVPVKLTKPFKLGKYEVTQGQWKKVMGTNTKPWADKEGVQMGDDNAASYVHWDGATEFCKRLTDIDHENGKLPAGESYRLPTEAEWEYACRAGTKTAFSFGDDESQLGEYAWFDENAVNVGEQYAHKVGMKKPNPWGLYDMHGNVWEWCSDWYGEKLSGGTDPVGPDGGSPNKNGVVVPYRVVRSGGWGSFGHDCHSAYRSYESTDTHSNSTGFRVARSQSVQ